ncbi:MAG: GDSL-type esterase/lipase family protein [Thaumarchaeota archaeon]|nr:GDSL-type esterase/lipase family protein [Nitrososphaerota archaeon]
MSTHRKVVALGDSTTAGTPGFRSPIESPPSGRGNPASQYGYWMMKLHPDWEVLNRGVNGERSDQILARFERDVSAERPDVVIILAGVNDIFQGRSAAYVEQNLQATYGLAKGLRIKTVGATILSYNIAGRREVQSMREVNSWLEAASKQGGMLFCDTRRAVSDPNNPDLLATTPDGIHPDVEGYRKMGEALAAVIEEGLR